MTSGSFKKANKIQRIQFCGLRKVLEMQTILILVLVLVFLKVGWTPVLASLE